MSLPTSIHFSSTRARSIVSTCSDDHAQRDGLRLGTVVLGFDPRQVEEVLDQRAQALGVAVDDVDEPFAGGRVARQRQPQGVDRRAHGGDRGAQLVRHVGDEVLAQRLEPADLADVDEHGEHALRACP